MNNLVPWRAKYLPFLMGLRLALSHHQADQQQLVANLAFLDGLSAITAWVFMAVARLEGEEGRPS